MVCQVFVSIQWQDLEILSYVPDQHNKPMIYNLTYVLLYDNWTQYLCTELNKQPSMNFERLVWCGTFGSTNLKEVLTKNFDKFVIKTPSLIILIIFLYFDGRCCK